MTRTPSFWWPAQRRSCVRCRTTRGRRSRSTGTPTQRFITAYAQDEARRAGLGITFTAVLPALTPLTDLGRPAVRAYAARSGQSEEEFLQKAGEPLTPEVAGAALVELLRADAATLAPEYLLTGAGLQKVPLP
jgi:hypothetical protein